LNTDQSAYFKITHNPLPNMVNVADTHTDRQTDRQTEPTAITSLHFVNVGQDVVS